MAPVRPCHDGMQDAKKDWTHDVARAVRVEMEHLRVQIGKNEITEPDEESIERLRKVGAAIVRASHLALRPLHPPEVRRGVHRAGSPSAPRGDGPRAPQAKMKKQFRRGANGLDQRSLGTVL